MSLEFLLIPRLICYQGLGDCVFWECQWSLLTRQNEPWEHVQWGGISVKSVTLGHQFFLQRFFFPDQTLPVFSDVVIYFLWCLLMYPLWTKRNIMREQKAGLVTHMHVTGRHPCIMGRMISVIKYTALRCVLTTEQTSDLHHGLYSKEVSGIDTVCIKCT